MELAAGAGVRQGAEGVCGDVSGWAAGKPPLQQEGILLKVPYEYQNDNRSGTGWRECMSSSCAMIARFYGKIASTMLTTPFAQVR
jgi:hypothetical protein